MSFRFLKGFSSSFSKRSNQNIPPLQTNKINDMSDAELKEYIQNLASIQSKLPTQLLNHDLAKKELLRRENLSGELNEKLKRVEEKYSAFNGSIKYDEDRYGNLTSIELHFSTKNKGDADNFFNDCHHAIAQQEKAISFRPERYKSIANFQMSENKDTINITVQFAGAYSKDTAAIILDKIAPPTNRLTV